MKPIIITFLLFLLSCSNYRKFYHTDSQIQNISKSPIIHRPQLVDLKIDTNKITGNLNITVSDPPTDSELKYAEKAVTFDLLKRTKNDLLVRPVFEMEQKGTSLDITVTGFPAKYISFKPITEDDLKLMETIKTSSQVNIATLDAYHEPILQEKKEDVGKVVLITFLIVLGVTALGAILAFLVGRK